MGNFRSHLTQMLFSAITEGRQFDAIELLKSGVSVNSRFDNESVIYTSVFCRQYKVMEYILQEKHVNIEDGFYTETPLHCACKNGDMRSVEMLVSAGADVNLVDHNHCTPLWLAVEAERTDIVDFLLTTPDLHADVNCSCKDRFMSRDSSCTPINKAAEMNNLEIVKVLAIHESDLNIPNNHGKVSLHHACYNGNTAMVKLLLSYNCDGNVLDEDGISPFYVACKHNHYEIVQLLISYGCDVNQCRSDSGWHCRGFSPLHVATTYHQYSTVKALLEAGADVNQGDFRDVQSLALACEEGQLEILHLLLSYNADVNHKDKTGSVALAYCFEYSHPYEVLQRLLQENVDVNVRMFDGEPILHYAVRQFAVDVPTMLISHGALLNILDKRDLNALYYAINMGKVAVTAVLLVHGARVTEYELENALTSLKISNPLLYVMLDIIDMNIIRNVFPKYQSGNKELMTQVHNVLCQPSQLKRLCRDVIRDCFVKKTNYSIIPHIMSLPLPHVILNYVVCLNHFQVK